MGYDSRDYYRPAGMGGFSVLPPVIKKILIINVVVYLVMMLASQIRIDGPVTLYHFIMKYFALIPLSNGGVYVNGAGFLPASFLPWQVITYQFMHSMSDFSHIFFNMFMLWMFGNEIENIMGSKKFLFFYLLAGTVGALLQLLFSSTVPTIGASGSVFGVMVAYAMFFPNRQLYVYFLFPVRAKYLIAFLVLIEFMAVGNMSVVAHVVHLGGALTGFLFVMLDRKNNYNIDGFFNKVKNSASSFTNSSGAFRRPSGKTHFGKKNIEDAEFYEINDEKSKTPKVSPSDIDKILDKISASGYQNLTDEEKRILFEASKKG